MRKIFIPMTMVLILCGVAFSGCISSNDSNHYSSSTSYGSSNNENYVSPHKVEPNFEKPVKLVLEETPISENSKIVSIEVINTKYINNLDEYPIDDNWVKNFMSKVKSMSLIKYDNGVESIIFNVENPDSFMDLIMEEFNDGDLDIYNVKLSGNGNKYEGYKVVGSGGVVYIIKKVGYNIVIVIFGDNEEDVKELTRGIGNGLPSYVKQEIYTLPKDMPSKYHLAYLMCHILDKEYVIEKGYAEWAKMMVGKWYCEAVYFDDNGHEISIGYIDLENVDYAKKVYDEVYSKERNNDENAEKVRVKGYDGWYVYSPIFDEVNFRVGYYLMFVSGIPPAGKDTLLDIAERLQV